MNGSAPALGNTRFNISVTVTSTRSPTLPPLVAHVHASRCSAVPPGGGHYLYNASLPDDAMAATWSTVPTYGSNTLSALLAFRNATFGATSSLQPWLANFDAALSVVIHDPAGRIACINLVPTLPNLPAEYSVTMEANFGFGKAYTMVLKEFASTAMGKRAIVMHTNTTSQAQVQDLSGNMSYTLVQNETFPNGLCTATPCIGTPLQPCSGSLSGLSTYYSLGSGAPIGFDGMNVQNVRGITCERWSRPFTMALGRGPPTNATAYFYFPTATWSNRGESYHRLLKRIQVNGTSARSGNFTHSYEFIDMVRPFCRRVRGGSDAPAASSVVSAPHSFSPGRLLLPLQVPAVQNLDVFNPCLLLHHGPQGVSLSKPVTGCGCEKFVMPAAGPAPPASCAAPSTSGGGQYGPGSMAAVALVLLLAGLCFGFYGERIVRRRQAAIPGHSRLVELS